MKTAKAYRPSEWLVDCPECGEITELGDINQAKLYCETPIDCECGLKFLVEEDFDG